MITKYFLNNNYRLQKYEITDDMSDPNILINRGTIYDNHTNEIVCRGFDKFFNLGEKYAAKIDWNTAKVIEKIDGTNIRIGFWGGEWRVSTLGVGDIINEPAESSDCDFGALVRQSVSNWTNFIAHLNPAYTYIFELTSAENRLVVEYESAPKLWFLGRREVKSGIEDRVYDGLSEEIGFPKEYNLHSAAEITNFLNTTSNFEGVVVVDANYNRVKIKSAEYLKAFRSMNVGGKLTYKRLLELMREGVLDDFANVAPDRVAEFMSVYQLMMHKWNSTFETLGRTCEDYKDVFAKIEPPMRDWVFKKKKNPNLRVEDYFDNNTRKSVLQAIDWTKNNCTPS